MGEGGRNVIVRRTTDGQTDITPSPFNARTRVHEYGAGLCCCRHSLLSNFADQRLYRKAGNAEPQPLTPAADMRYADYIDRLRVVSSAYRNKPVLRL